MKNFFRQHLLSSVIGLAVVVSVVIGGWYVLSNNAPSFTATTASTGNVISSLDEAATVLADNNANLSFQEAGQIAQVNVQEGDTVNAGAVLASLSSDSLQANVDEANAALAAAQANLDQLQAGTRPQELAIDQTSVTNAQSALSVDLGNAYTAADDAVHNQIDNLFNEPKSINPEFLVPMNDSQMQNQIQSARLSIESTLTNWYSTMNASSASGSTLSAPTSTVSVALNQIQSFLDLVALAVNDATPNSTMTPSVLAGYKVNVATARTEVGAAITTITTAESTLASAQNTLELAEAGSTPQDIEAQQAVVAQAQAGAAAARVALDNASIIAPFSGTVQNLTAQVGQVVSPGAPVLSLVNNGGLKIQAYASEADVANIKMGDVAQITLDAFGTGTQFPATVTSVGDVETDVNGAPAYLITLHFTNPEPQVNDGMTGNAHIILAEDDNVVEVPSRLVINQNSQYFVLVQTPNGSEQQAVQIGIVGDNGMTEIKSGITEGEQLVNF